MTYRLLPLLIGLPLAVAAQAGPDSGGGKYAWLVENTSYKPLPSLPSVSGAVDALNSALEKAGFKVSRTQNCNFEDCQKALVNFIGALHQNDTVFFYFAGYTVYAEDNYLLPVNFDPNSADPLNARALPLPTIQLRIDRKTAAPKFFMLESPYKLDAPIPGATGGVQDPNSTELHESLVAFAANPGQSVQAPGLFTQKVAAAILKPGMGPEGVFAEAKSAVEAETHDQNPRFINTITKKFLFTPPRIPPPPPTPAGTTAHSSGDNEDYVWIPKGQFQMGCIPGDERCRKNESPRHAVQISKGFWLGRNEVPVLSYFRYAGKKMPHGPLEDKNWSHTANPMVNVTWQAAHDYCAWAHGRLPTEAEWEYAARAGSETVFPFAEADSPKFANSHIKDEAIKKMEDRTIAVHSLSPNAWQLYDMSGNVWEWVSDFYSETYYQDVASSVAVDPQGPQAGKDHVVRGGGFDSFLDVLRTSYRKPMSGANAGTGFRCVLEDSPQTDKLLGRESKGKDVKPQ